MQAKRSLSLVVQPSHLVFTENNEYTRPSLLISRTPNVEVQLKRNPSLVGTVYEKLAYAILGVVPLLSGPHILLVTECEAVGNLDGHAIYVVKEIELMPILEKAAFERLSAQHQTEERLYIELIHQVLKSPFFYFSYTFNLSKSFAHYAKQKAGKLGSSMDNDTASPVSRKRTAKSSSDKTKTDALPNEPDLWRDIEERFVWNTHMQSKFFDLSGDFGNWFPPLIQGFISIKKDNVVNDKKFDFALISRRSKKRAGVRFYTRGVDAEGNVANHVETEQILHFPDDTYTSFVQLRGSVPVVWSQDPNMDYDPPIVVSEEESQKPFQLHFEDQLKQFDKIVAVDLLQGRGKELKVGGAYQRHAERLGNGQLKYVPFDVHHICKVTNYDKLSLLVDKVKDDAKEMKYTVFNSAANAIKRTQKGVFRSNCKDCLDRTNLVQGVFARMSLIDQLKDFGYIRDQADLADIKNADFMHFFRNVWADNGDTISIFYAGTGALKSGVTRTGKSTYKGLMSDGVNSLTRYYLNNLKDGFRQDAIELLLGNYVPSRVSTPYSEGTETKIFYVITVILSFFHMIAPKSMRYKYDFVAIMLWLLLLVFLGKVLRLKHKVINKPRLMNHRKKKLH